MLTRQVRAERGADLPGRLCPVSWDTWMRSSPGRALTRCRGAAHCCAHVSTGRTPALPGWSWTRVQLPKGIIQVYVTSCCGESSFSEIICGICLSTHYNVASLLLEHCSYCITSWVVTAYKNTLSVTNLWTCMHYGVRGCCDRGMTGCLFFAGFLFSSGKYQAPNQGGSNPGAMRGLTPHRHRWIYTKYIKVAPYG